MKTRILLVLALTACLALPALPTQARFGADDSITINSATLSVASDAPENGVADIGDQITVQVIISNTDGGCVAAGTDVSVDLTAYGGSPTQLLTCQTDNGGVGDVFSTTQTIADAGVMGLDVAASNEDSAVEIEVTDAVEDDGLGNPDPTATTNVLALAVDSIAPYIASADIDYGTYGSGLDGIFLAYDEVIIEVAVGGVADLTEVTVDFSPFGGSDEAFLSDTGCGGTADDGIWEACTWVPSFDEQPLDESDINTVATMTDDAGNTYENGAALLTDVDNSPPALAAVEPISFMKQDGSDPSARTRFWYLYGDGGVGSDNLQLEVLNAAEADGEPLSEVRLCVKSLLEDDQTVSGICSLSEFQDDKGPWLSMTELDATTFITDELDLPAWPTGTGGYSMNLYLIDHAGNATIVEEQDRAFVALFGINPIDMDPMLDNGETTDWSTLTDFTDVTDLVFSAQQWDGDLGEMVEWGRLTFVESLNLCDQTTADGLSNLMSNIEISGEDIRLDSDALLAMNSDATLLMKVPGGRPGLRVLDNDGATAGYVPHDQVGATIINGDSLGDFAFDEDHNFTFSTTGFSEFISDNEPPAPTSVYPTDGGSATKGANVRIVFSEEVDPDTFEFTDDDLRIALDLDPYTYTWNRTNTEVSVGHDDWTIGEEVRIRFSVDDMVGNGSGDYTSTFTVRAASSSSGGTGTTYAPSTTPTVTLNRPAGGEEWDAGAVENLTWSVGGVGIQTVKLEYSTDGVVWTLIADDVNKTLGTYAWTLPNLSTASARVRITGQDSAKGGVAVDSSSNFTISQSAAEEQQEQEQQQYDTEQGITTDADGHRDAPPSGQQGASPFDGKIESISKVLPGWYIRGENFDTVYLVTSDLKRRPFWDAASFMTWASGWDDVIWVSNATLATLPIGEPVLMQPGAVMVKITSDPRVFWVEEGAAAPEPYELRWVSTETIASTMFGARWMDYILDVEPTVFARYHVGTDLTAPEAVDTSKMVTRAEVISRVAGH